MAYCTLFYFVSWGIIGGALCVFGFFGNTLSLLAFQKDKRSPASTLLQSLAMSDFFLLLSVFITDSVPYICDYVSICVNPWYTWPFIRYIWILTPIAHMCSIWFVVLIALNRYYAVCQATDMSRVWNNQRTPIYICVVLFVVVTFNMPRFFEYRMIQVPCSQNYADENTNDMSNSSLTPYGFDNNSVYNISFLFPPSPTDLAYTPTPEIVNIDKNITVNSNMKFPESDYDESNISCWKWTERRTKFGSHSSYKVVYKVLLVNILLVLVPIILLIAFTLKILISLRETKRRIRTMKGTNKGNKNGVAKKGSNAKKKNKKSHEITLILVLVVVVAIICQAPLCVFHFVRYTARYNCGHIVFYLDNISKLLVNVNSSANFIIYCLFSPRFRRLLLSFWVCYICGFGPIKNSRDAYTSISRKTEYSTRESKGDKLMKKNRGTPLMDKKSMKTTELNRQFLDSPDASPKVSPAHSHCNGGATPMEPIRYEANVYTGPTS